MDFTLIENLNEKEVQEQYFEILENDLISGLYFRCYCRGTNDQRCGFSFMNYNICGRFEASGQEFLDVCGSRGIPGICCPVSACN